jgi:hypothetical protein
MKTYLFVSLFVVAGLLTAWATSSAAQSSFTIQVVEHADTDVVADIAPADDSVGDVLTFANVVFDKANTKQVGTDNGYCLRTVVGEAWECAWTMTLADGQLSVAGPFYDTQDSVLSITGGTGAYSGVRGQMKLHARNAEGTEYDFIYEITP